MELGRNIEKKFAYVRIGQWPFGTFADGDDDGEHQATHDHKSPITYVVVPSIAGIKLIFW